MGMVCARAASAARAIMSGSSEPSSSARTPARSSRRPRRVACSIASVDSKRPRTHDGIQPQRGEEAQIERHRFAGVARDVGVDGDGGEALGLAGAKERQVEVGLAPRADRLEEAKDDVGRLHQPRERLERTRRARARDRRWARTRRARAHARCRPGRRRRSRCRRRSAAPLRSRRRDRPARRRRAPARSARGARVWNDGLAIGTSSCARGTTSSASAYSCARTCIDVGARRRAHADGDRGLVGDHVEGDAAVELGDVHAHAAKAERTDLALRARPTRRTRPRGARRRRAAPATRRRASCGRRDRRWRRRSTRCRDGACRRGTRSARRRWRAAPRRARPARARGARG